MSSGGEWSYWRLSDQSSFVEVLIIIASYLVFSRFLSKIFVVETRQNLLKNEMYRLSEDMSGITDINELGTFLAKRMRKIFKTNSFELRIFGDDERTELAKFFDSNKKETSFLNDAVFMGERAESSNIEKVAREFSDEQFVAVPISGAWRGSPVCDGALIL